jgi:hypothetical protein
MCGSPSTEPRCLNGPWAHLQACAGQDWATGETRRRSYCWRQPGILVGFQRVPAL